MKLFVTAIGTGCGKTIVSAILCEKLQADYWKPIQSGLEERDSDTVKQLISNQKTVIHPERYALQFPASPHIAAARENISIALSDFTLPETQNNLIVEGAGGILVPINQKGEMVVDLVTQFAIELILVVPIYLGCINHTLLTYNELIRRGIAIKGLIFNGDENKEVEDTILQLTQLKCLLRIKKETIFDKEKVQFYANQLQF